MYVVCRQQERPQLLIDFADKLQVNLYKLGNTYLKLIKILHFPIPNIDPCLFIWRFCEKLGFGEKQHEVGLTALRIMQSMKRDWMFHGRRPTGLVGAAILIAARYHGFKRTTNQMVQTVHVCDETIRKRLVEFKQTKTAALTLDEFQNTNWLEDIKTESDPPAFKKALKAKEILKLPNIENALTKSASQIEEKLNTDDTTNLKEEEREPEGLSDFSDSEINEFLLTPHETMMKSAMWHNLNKEWIEEQKEKEKKKTGKENVLADILNETRRKKKKIELVDAKDPVSA